jgi:hypothetical protein
VIASRVGATLLASLATPVAAIVIAASVAAATPRACGATLSPASRVSRV